MYALAQSCTRIWKLSRTDCWKELKMRLGIYKRQSERVGDNLCTPATAGVSVEDSFELDWTPRMVLALHPLASLDIVVRFPSLRQVRVGAIFQAQDRKKGPPQLRPDLFPRALAPKISLESPLEL
jgi:hypothetical protein